jgi:TetR/AcrR family transcriptional repressor of lmrAB and yxaGH operons
MRGWIRRSMLPSIITESASKSESPRPDTRLRLILAAVRLFQERGYHGTGTADILLAARAPRGSLYHHFKGGKAELASAAAAWLADEVTSRIERLRSKGVASSKVVESLARASAVWLEATRYRQGSLLAALTAGLGAEPSLAPAVASAYCRIEEVFKLTFAASGIDARAAAALAQTTMVELEGGLLLARARRDSHLLVARMNRVSEQIRRACA